MKSKPSAAGKPELLTTRMPAREHRQYGYRVGRKLYKSYIAAFESAASGASILEMHTGRLFPKG